MFFSDQFSHKSVCNVNLYLHPSGLAKALHKIYKTVCLITSHSCYKCFYYLYIYGTYISNCRIIQSMTLIDKYLPQTLKKMQHFVTQLNN